MFGRATITLGIGPHSSLVLLFSFHLLVIGRSSCPLTYSLPLPSPEYHTNDTEHGRRLLTVTRCQTAANQYNRPSSGSPGSANEIGWKSKLCAASFSIDCARSWLDTVYSRPPAGPPVCTDAPDSVVGYICRYLADCLGETGWERRPVISQPTWRTTP